MRAEFLARKTSKKEHNCLIKNYMSVECLVLFLEKMDKGALKEVYLLYGSSRYCDKDDAVEAVQKKVGEGVLVEFL